MPLAACSLPAPASCMAWVLAWLRGGWCGEVCSCMITDEAVLARTVHVCAAWCGVYSTGAVCVDCFAFAISFRAPPTEHLVHTNDLHSLRLRFVRASERGRGDGNTDDPDHAKAGMKSVAKKSNTEREQGEKGSAAAATADTCCALLRTATGPFGCMLHCFSRQHAVWYVPPSHMYHTF